MSIDDIILIMIILASGVYIGRRVYLVIFSKKPPTCPGCGGDCPMKLPNTSNNTTTRGSCKNHGLE